LESTDIQPTQPATKGFKVHLCHYLTGLQSQTNRCADWEQAMKWERRVDDQRQGFDLFRPTPIPEDSAG
ncbi:hypothetical protein T06_12397, partial [Trichinella sp. T6]